MQKIMYIYIYIYIDSQFYYDTFIPPPGLPVVEVSSYQRGFNSYVGKIVPQK